MQDNLGLKALGKLYFPGEIAVAVLDRLEPPILPGEMECQGCWWYTQEGWLRNWDTMEDAFLRRSVVACTHARASPCRSPGPVNCYTRYWKLTWSDCNRK